MAVDCAAAYGYNVDRTQCVHLTHETPVTIAALRGLFVGKSNVSILCHD